MEEYEARLASFTSHKSKQKWPHPPSFIATPKSLASAGFYYSPRSANSKSKASATAQDRTQCYKCGVVLEGWKPTDFPRVEHRVYSPSCALHSTTPVSPAANELLDDMDTTSAADATTRLERAAFLRDMVFLSAFPK